MQDDNLHRDESLEALTVSEPITASTDEPVNSKPLPAGKLKQIIVPGPDGTFVTKYVLTNRQQRRADEKSKRKPGNALQKDKTRKSKSR